MSGDTYSIYVKVDSTQAKTAAKDLEKLGEASVTAEVSIKKVGTASTEASTKMDAAAKAAKQQADWFGKLSQAAEPSVLWITKLSSASASASGAINNVEENTKKAAAGMDVFSTAVSLASRTTLLFIGIELARAIRDGMNATKEAADAYTNMKSKLDIATYSQQELNKAFEDSFNIANKYYTSVTDVASAYAKFNPIVASLGRNTADTAKIVESLSASLLISGNNTVDASETFRQFAQAISGPKVQMEEMNTIIDSNQALWRGLQREFPDIIAKYGSLKEAISKQAISNEMLINATIKLGDEFEALAARKVPTIENAMTVLNNSFVQYVGEANDASGASSALANIILDLAESLRSVEGKGQSLAAIINVIAQAMAGTRGAVADYIDLMAGLANAFSGFSMAQNQMDPEIAKLMKLGAGQVPIADLAAKPTVKPTTQPQLTPRGTGVDSKKASKEAKDALDAFKATIAAQLSAAENAEKLYDAMSNNSKKRYDIERERVQGLAELKIRSTKSETMRLAITEEAQAKIVDAINQETNLRQAAVDKEMETLAIKMSGVKQELDAADANKLKQAERIELATKLADVETEMSVKRAERTQIELDAIGKIQEADQALAEARQKASETLVKEEALRQLEVMSSNLEYAKEMATGLADAFGEVGAAIGGMSVAMAEYDKQSATIEIARKEAVDKAEGDQKRIIEINDDAAKKQAKAQIKSYGDMTQAAQGFFKKGTKGYEAMGAAVKVFRAFEMAQSAMSFMDQMNKQDGLFSSFKDVLTQMGILSAQQTQQQITEATQKGAADATAGAAHQGTSGDPYTAFARVAAWVALMAGLGIMIGGGGGGGGGGSSTPSLSGTGTVLGDPGKQSESIANSLSMLVDLNTNDLAYSADMLASLKAIENALSDASALIAKQVMPIIGGIVSQFSSSGMMSSKQVKEAGFLVGGQSLNKVLASGLLQGYMGARVESTTGLLGEFHSGQTMLAKYGSDIAKAFGKIVTELYKTITASAEKIGVPMEEIRRRAEGLKVGLGKVNLAGMSAEEAAKTIESAFSAMGDKMAIRILPEFKDFQRNGEGYFQTIVRVGSGIAEATGRLENLGMKAVNYSEIANKTGDVASEIAKKTIILQSDLGDGAKRYVEQLTGNITEIIDGYKKLKDITQLMNIAGLNGQALDRVLVNSSGGLDALTESLQSFVDNFVSPADRTKASWQAMADNFTKLGLKLPRTNDEFYKLVKSIDLQSESGKKLFGTVISLSSAFSELTASMADAMDKLTEAYNRQKGVAASLREFLAGAGSDLLSPEQKYQTSKTSFQEMLAKALGGDESAQSKLKDAAAAFLEESKTYFASSAGYATDLATVQTGLGQVATTIESQLTVAEMQVSALTSNTNAVLSLSEALSQYLDLANAGYQPGYIANSAGTYQSFSELKNAIMSGDNQQITELQALVRLQSAANSELIAQMTEMKNQIAELTRNAKLEASA